MENFNNYKDSSPQRIILLSYTFICNELSINKKEFGVVILERINKRYIQEILKTNAKQIFSGQAQSRAIRDIWIKSNYILSLLEVADKVSLNLKRAKILDIGCSKCDLLLALLKMGFENLTGVNLFPYDLKWLSDKAYFKRYFGNSAGKIKYIICDVEKEPLPFKDSRFDVILLFDVIEHLHDPERILKEIYRVSHRGALLAIGTPNVANLRNRINIIFGRSIYCPLNEWLSESQRINDGNFRRFIGHIREYTMEEVEFMMKKYGFKEVLLKKWYASHLQHGSVIYSLYQLLEKLYPKFAYHMLIISRKIM